MTAEVLKQAYRYTHLCTAQFWFKKSSATGHISHIQLLLDGAVLVFLRKPLATCNIPGDYGPPVSPFRSTHVFVAEHPHFNISMSVTRREGFDFEAVHLFCTTP